MPNFNMTFAVTLSFLAFAATAQAKIKPDTSPSLRTDIYGVKQDILDLDIVAATRDQLLSKATQPLDLIINPTLNTAESREFTGRFPNVSTYIQIAATQMMKDTGLRPLRADTQCTARDGRPRYTIESQIAGFDETVRFVQSGRTLFADENLISADLERGNYSKTDTLFLNATVFECGSEEIGRGYVVPLEITGVGIDKSNYFFLKVIGTYNAKIETRSVGNTTALNKGLDLILAQTLLDLTDTPVKEARMVFVPRPTRVTDAVVSTGRRTYKDKRYYFPIGSRRFNCNFKTGKNCHFSFELGRGRYSDIEEYLRRAALSSGGSNVQVTCTENRRKNAQCVFRGHLSDINTQQFRKNLYSRD